MPFPLAHPAAVLPLRRYCHRWLNFPALVIGSLVPDVGYLFDDQGIGASSHQFFGSLAFGLPIGVLMLLALYGFRSLALKKMPAARKRALLPLYRRPIGPLWIVGISLLIGIWTHVFWDSFTHTDGWFVQHLSILQSPIIQFDGHTARVCHLLWYGSSFAGVGWLFFAFEKWKKSRVTSAAGVSGKNMFQDAILLAVLVVPISLIHHLMRNPLGLVLTAFCLLLSTVFVVKTA